MPEGRTDHYDGTADDLPPAPPDGVPPLGVISSGADTEPGGAAPAVPGYAIEGELGRGGMGVVYKARQAGLNRTVALKMVVAGRAGARALARFLAEAEAVAAAEHPHVVRVFEFGDHGGRPYLAMEYLPGGSLADRLRRGGRPAPAAAAGLVERVARGVAAAHALGIVHRDLKPGNVLFDAAGEPKVTDFGLAKRAASDLTNTGVVMGTPAYMAPEQAAGGSKFVGPAADVWALGAILYECLTGGPPFTGTDVESLLYRVMTADPPRPRARSPAVPRDLELVCRKCLEKDPADRYPTAAELADDLRRFAAGEPVSVKPAGVVVRAAKWARRNPTRAAAYLATGTAVVLAGLTAGAVGLWRQAETARAQAEGARGREEEFRRTAEVDRDTAVRAREGEAVAKWEAEQARDALARLEDARKVELAHREAGDNHYARARQLLADCRPAGRDWEWRYVHRLCHPDRLTLPHPGPVYAAALSPDGRRVVSAAENDTRFAREGRVHVVREWDADTGRPLRALTVPLRTVRAVAFDRSGRRLLVAGQDGAVLLDADAGRPVRTFGQPGAYFAAAALSPDGTRVAVVDATDWANQKARVWDADSGRPLLLAPDPAGVGSVAFSPDGTRLAVAARHQIAVYEVATGREVGTAYPGGPVAFHPDGRRLGAGRLTGMRDVVAVRGTEARMVRFVQGPGANQMTEAVAFSPDGKHLTTVGGDGLVRSWDPDTVIERPVRGGHELPVRCVSYSGDGARLATGGDDRTVRVWGAAPPPFRMTEEEAVVRRVSRDGRRMAVVAIAGPAAASAARAVVVRDADTGVELFRAAAASGEVQAVALDGTGRRVAHVGGRYDGPNRVRVWDVETRQVRLHLPADPRAERVELSPDGRWLAVARYDGAVRAFDVDIGGEVPTPWPAPAEISRRPTPVLCFAPDGRSLAVVPPPGGGIAAVWEVAAGGRVTPLPMPLPEPATALEYSPDARRLAAGTGSLIAPGAVVLWDLAAPDRPRVLAGHTLGVEQVRFGPGGRRLFTAGRDGAVRVWDPEAGYELLNLQRGSHPHFLKALSVEEDRVRGWSGGTAVVWDAAPVNLAFAPREAAPPPRPVPAGRPPPASP